MIQLWKVNLNHDVTQKISYLHFSWIQAFLAVKSIKSIYHWRNGKPFSSWKTEDPGGVFRTHSKH